MRQLFADLSWSEEESGGFDYGQEEIFDVRLKLFSSP